MKIKTCENLESTGYRCLLEYVKKEGIEPLLCLLEDINKLYNLDILIHQTIMGEENNLIKIAKNNKDIITYLSEHKNEFAALKLTNKNVLDIMRKLSNNMNMLNIYLENARMLEELKVAVIRHVCQFESSYECEIYRNDDKKIICISKYYTDGNIIAEKEILIDEMFGCSEIPFKLQNATFLLEANNNEKFYQYRGIFITDFGFDKSKLPSEEELEKYDIPGQLIKK